MSEINLLSINDKYYAINLEKIIEFCKMEQNTINTITHVYTTDENNTAKNLSLIDKNVSETTENTNEIMSNYRFNLVNNLLNLILMPISDGSGAIITTEELSNMHLGQKLALNTMLEMGIIYETTVE